MLLYMHLFCNAALGEWSLPAAQKSAAVSSVSPFHQSWALDTHDQLLWFIAEVNEGLALPYLRELFWPTTYVQCRCSFHSATQAKLIVLSLLVSNAEECQGGRSWGLADCWRQKPVYCVEGQKSFFGVVLGDSPAGPGSGLELSCCILLHVVRGD